MTAQATPIIRATRGDELRLAAIDVGSNSLHMVIAQADAAGGVTTLWRAKEMVGLGRLSFPSHRLSRDTMERGVQTLRRFVEEAQRRQSEQVLAIATSAVREATNGGQFIERVRRELGLHVQVISAHEEARLIYLAVRQAMAFAAAPQLTIDIGGGSVEFIVGNAQTALLLESRKLGAARMSARYVNSDPIDADDLRRLCRHYDRELSPLIERIRAHKPTRMIGTSGTIENLAAMCGTAMGANGGPGVLRRDDLSKLLSTLMESTSSQRAKMPGLDDQRKDQILAGALLLHEVMQRLDVQELQLCSAALREGMLVDYLAKHRPELQVRSCIPDPRRRAVIDLGRRCHWPREHSEQVTRLCLRLFDQLHELHGLGRRSRELIEYGALLHDIGAMISPRKHHKHSQYLIQHGNLLPFSQREVEIIGNIARYHRKALPQMKHASFATLGDRDRHIVQVGAALLRVADGLDRTNGAVVEDLRCRIKKRSILVRLSVRSDAELEIWSAQSRSELLRQLFGRHLGLQARRPGASKRRHASRETAAVRTQPAAPERGCHACRHDCGLNPKCAKGEKKLRRQTMKAADQSQ